MADKIFCGSGKKKTDKWLQVTVNPDIIAKHIQEYNGNKFVKLNINIGQVNKFGKDVQISIDTWTPDGAKTTTDEKPAEAPKAPEPKEADDGDLPF